MYSFPYLVMKTFEFKGTFRKGTEHYRKFTKKIESNSEREAKEKLYSIFGALYKCPRRFIRLKK